MVSVKKNFFYSALLTGANYIFPLIVFPYVSRVLGVTNLGACNFVDSIVHYFIIFSMLGIDVVGIREIAKTKGDKDKLNQCFSSLFIINTILTSIALIVYLVCIYTIPKLHDHLELMWIGAAKLCFNYLLIEWLFKGLEEFKFITSRSLIIKTLYVVSVFVFVKKPGDYLIFFLLTSLNVVLNALVNCIYSKKYVSFSFRSLNIKAFLPSILLLGVYAILTNMYTTFNVAFLGFSAGETEVGYYTTANKIFAISLSLFTALTGVLLPRMSALIAENQLAGYKHLLCKTTDFLVAVSFPAIAFVVFIAPEIIRLISGKGYEGAIVPLQIMIPLLFIIGYEQVLVIQGLMPLKKDKAILINSIIGASVGITCNILLVPVLKGIGSSIVWVISELAVLLVAQFFMRRFVGIRFPWKKILYNAVFLFPLVVFLYFLKGLPFSYFVSLSTAIVLTGIYTFLLQICILKTPSVIQVYDEMKDRFHQVIKR